MGTQDIQASDFPTKFTAIVEHWSLPVMMLDRHFNFTYANTAYLKSTVKQWEEISGRHVFEVFPDTSDHVEDVYAQFAKTLRGERTVLNTQPYALTHEDGREELRYWQATQEPVWGDDGTVTHLIQYAEDVTMRVRAEQDREVIVREMNHRVKNVMSVIQSVARLSSRGQTSVKEFAANFIDRINAMSRNHDRLFLNDFSGSDLHDILSEELHAMTDLSSQSFDLNGPPVTLSAELAKDASIVIHELATNAAKYGCFSEDTGHLDVSWKQDAEAVTLLWHETGVGPITLSDREGFGTKLIRMLRNIDCNRTAHNDGITIELILRQTR